MNKGAILLLLESAVRILGVARVYAEDCDEIGAVTVKRIKEAELDVYASIERMSR